MTKMNLSAVLITSAYLFTATMLQAQSTTYSAETSNNTSACPASGTLPTGCTAAFTGLTDHYAKQDANNTYQYPGPSTTPPASNTADVITVPAASNMSLIPFNTMLYPQYSGQVTTQVLCFVEPWFGSTSHITIGMDMRDGNNVDRQIQNLINRGCNYVSLDWYGSGSFENTVAQAWRDNIDNRCAANGGVCPIQMTIMEDQGTQSGLNMTGFETDVSYLHANFMGHASYWKMNWNGCTNRPVLLPWGWNSVLDWSAVRSWIESPSGLNTVCNGEPLLAVSGT